MYVERLEAGYDWCALSLPEGCADTARFYAQGMEQVLLETEAGNQAKVISLNGYKGCLSGKCFIGEREDGLYFRATGSSANRAFAAVYSDYVRVSRLDVQVTVWMDNNYPQIGKTARKQAINAARTPSGHTLRKVHRHDSNNGGYTLYVGSRSSEHFLRLYDKSAESSDSGYLNAWRYELQLTNDYATDAAKHLRTGVCDEPLAITHMVWKYCADRGIKPVFNPLLPLIVFKPTPREETDDIRSLRWLSQQVRPTVDRLLKSGYTDDVLEALGLLPSAIVDGHLT